MKKKMLFLYLKTGGGHFSAAKSIKDYLMSTYDDMEIVLGDGLENGNKVVRAIIEDGYRLSQSIALWVYELLYGFHKVKPISKMTTKIVSNFIKPKIKEFIENHNPEKIVIFHFFLVDPVLKVLKEMKVNIPVLTVVTDPYTAHPMWFMHKNLKYILFSEEVLENSARKMKISDDNVQIFPYILNEKFRYDENVKPDDLKNKLGFELNKDVVLLMGGGDGIPKGEKILKNLLAELPNVEYAVVCGRDKQLYSTIEDLKISNNLENIKIFGYIDNVNELMIISDIVISKCGPSTFMEILLSKKVPVISSYIWEQEKGNVDFLKDNQLGIYENNIKKIPQVVSKLLNDVEYRNSFLDSINKTSLENGTSKVGDFIHNY
ncbi:MAG: hypothetical protein JXR48_07060 [Candidatus Delongbacteria bacterium]|nr:hypothetical protein [Candidatus Delongbacteria bacterium]MBN2834710.1 hypothetical protein [Candidatus Delongbacteria bacterium]